MTRFMLGSNRLAPTAMAVVALLGAIAVLGWSSYFYSARSFESRDRERLETLARVTSERDALSSGQQQLVLEQGRLERELALSNAQLIAAQDVIASHEQQQKLAKKSDGAPGELVDQPRKGRSVRQGNARNISEIVKKPELRAAKQGES
jgi:hypothetical protein